MSALPIDAPLLVIMPTWVGDCVMATPLLRALSARGGGLWLAVPSPLTGLLEGPSAQWRCVAVDAKGLLGPARAARQLRGAGIPKGTAALLLPNSMRSALLALASGCRARVGYATQGRRLLLTHPVPPPQARPISAVDWYAALGERLLGCGIEDLRLSLPLSREERDAAARLLEGVPRPFAVLAPGGNDPAKRWPVERFAALARRLRDAHGLASVAVGSPGEASLLAELAGAGVTSLQQRGLTLSSLKGVLAEADLLVSNDTGTRHIAAAMETPTVALFGPTDPRWTTLPIARERIVTAQPFLPEDRVADDHAAACAIDRIALADVVQACARALSPTP